ncbi:MAG: helicase [Prevotella ruminicola]|jgi:predicted P-loop ATPase|uniref:Helicase n=1 Tax=Xylanibacter ruminicola TaxID=839 RepID=A0A9D5NYF7_XYLRU|nr:helicase [Xylanibacter ruminicola]
MSENCITTSEANNASQEATLAIELFLNENYVFRRNTLNGKVEYAVLPKADVFRPLTKEALNSIVIRAKREQVLEKGSPKTEITEYVESEEVSEYNPAQAFLTTLPKWDGQNHIARIFGRIPGISSEQLNYLTIWLRSAVAHWLQMDMLHGNECVPTFIGSQGCGKTTFVRRLLPPELREYYLDHLNLSNKFDKEMALTNNLIVNLDELEAIGVKQQSKLKQTLSVSKVNGRPIFGRTQQDRPRFASFVATTNNPHPLTDPTGSRRYICIQIPDGHLINNEGDIDYQQLYAQVVYELQELKAPYWFGNDEVARIQQLNQDFMEQKDLGEMFVACFRHPEEGEVPKTMNCDQMIVVMQKSYPSLTNTIGNKVRLGKTIKALGFKHRERAHISYYDVMPIKVA